MPKVNLRRAAELARKHEPFETTTGAVRGVSYPDGTRRLDTGMGSTRVPDGCTYVVFSYATPIAWVEDCGRAVRTHERFSITTSAKHMPVTYSMPHREGADPAEIARRDEADRIAREEAEARAKAMRAEVARERRAQRKRERIEARYDAALQAASQSAALAEVTQILMARTTEQLATTTNSTRKADA